MPAEDSLGDTRRIPTQSTLSDLAPLQRRHLLGVGVLHLCIGRIDDVLRVWVQVALDLLRRDRRRRAGCLLRGVLDERRCEAG